MNVDSSSLISATRQSLQALDVQRKSLEEEASAIVSELTSESGENGAVMGVDTPLIDPEGYPRGDVDVMRARTLRGRLAVIRNDHKDLMKEVEKYLQQLAMLQKPSKSEEEKEEHASRMQVKPLPKYDPVSGKWVVMNWDGSVAGVPGGEKRRFHNLGQEEPAQAMETLTIDAGGENTAMDTNESSPQPTVTRKYAATADTATCRPIARVNSVADNSPAQQAGLSADDLIVAFGPVSSESNPADFLRVIGEMVPVAAGEQQSIEIVVQRLDGQVRVELKPQPWQGRGLLGCHIVPHII